MRSPGPEALRRRAARALSVTAIRASGLDVGLPDGVMGNSEVGHENIGAGRIVEQELLRLNQLFADKPDRGQPGLAGARSTGSRAGSGGST